MPRIFLGFFGSQAAFPEGAGGPAAGAGAAVWDGLSAAVGSGCLIGRVWVVDYEFATAAWRGSSGRETALSTRAVGEDDLIATDDDARFTFQIEPGWIWSSIENRRSEILIVDIAQITRSMRAGDVVRHPLVERLGRQDDLYRVSVGTRYVSLNQAWNATLRGGSTFASSDASQTFSGFTPIASAFSRAGANSSPCPRSAVNVTIWQPYVSM